MASAPPPGRDGRWRLIGRHQVGPSVWARCDRVRRTGEALLTDDWLCRATEDERLVATTNDVASSLVSANASRRGSRSPSARDLSPEGIIPSRDSASFAQGSACGRVCPSPSRRNGEQREARGASVRIRFLSGVWHVP